MMFGTLVSSDFSKGTFEYIGNPDSVAAVSRNIRDKIHISCVFCRSRKVRCSGGRKRCQRCIAMGLECVYPEKQGRIKPQENNKSRRASIRRQSIEPTRAAQGEVEPSAGSNRINYSEELVLDHLDEITFDDSCIDEALFTPWIMDTPACDGFTTPSSVLDFSRSGSTFSSATLSTTVTPPDLPPELPDSPSTQQLNNSGPGSTVDVESWEGSHIMTGDIGQVKNADGSSSGDSSSEPMSLEPLGKVQTGSDSCSCQARSISLLERLVSKAASRENRIDVLLADVRNSIATLAIFMACTRCASRDEQNMLLAMAARQISIICAQMANCFKSLQQSGAEAPQTQADLDASIGPVDIFVSTYRVSRRERLHMLKSLVTLQTIELQQHLDAIKARCGPAGQVFVTEAEKQVTTAQTAIRSTSS